MRMGIARLVSPKWEWEWKRLDANGRDENSTFSNFLPTGS